MNDSKKPMATSNINTKLVRELADLMAEKGLSEVEISDGGKTVRVSRGTGTAQPAAAPPQPARKIGTEPFLQAAKRAPSLFLAVRLCVRSRRCPPLRQARRLARQLRAEAQDPTRATRRIVEADRRSGMTAGNPNVG